MRSSSGRGIWLLLTALSAIAFADPPEPVQPFSPERLYLSAPGGGYLVMDALSMSGPLSGALSLTFSEAHDPLRIGSARSVVGDEAIADIGAAVSWRRFRAYANVQMPLLLTGQDAQVDGWAYSAPSVNLSSHPDTLSDVRLGLDARLLGEPNGPFRIGLGAQLFVPSGEPNDYVSDGTYRGMARLLFAGDTGQLSWAGHVGAHLRPVDDDPAPEAPRGSELLFGAAAGYRFGQEGDALVVGPELFGATAFRTPFAKEALALEALLSARLDVLHEGGVLLRAKLGAGGGLNPHFGAPALRVTAGIEFVYGGVSVEPAAR